MSSPETSRPSASPYAGEHLFLVTGRLASGALSDLLRDLAPQVGFQYTLQTLPITVAALMTSQWILRRWTVPPDATRVVLPGYCLGDLEPLRQAAGIPVERGPRDLRELPEFLGGETRRAAALDDYDIEIIAEINHAPRLSLDEVLRIAHRYRQDGADRIDVGCDPDGPWQQVGACIGALRELDFRVSIDSLDPREIAPAVEAGADLVLSVNAGNRGQAHHWGCEVVVIPDDFATLGGLDESIEMLASEGVGFRIDPVLEPIGMGFAASLQRYLDVRRRYPQAEMMMGIGNLTELTDVDSAGVNFLLLGICQELGIRSILTTEVINWARTSVRECDIARRLVRHSVVHGVLPKRLSDALVMLRDVRLLDGQAEQLPQLAREIKDPNYRIFADEGELHLVSAGLHLSDPDPFVLLQQLLGSSPAGGIPENLDASHAFYLGYEMCKAVTALTLGKQYRQDQPLDWGMLTREETSHRAGPQGKHPS